jgi:hypothetical protein
MNFIAQKNKKLNDARLQAAQTQQQAMTLVQQTQQQVSSAPLIFFSCVTKLSCHCPASTIRQDQG